MLDKFFQSNPLKPLPKKAQVLFFILGLGFVGLGLNQVFYERSKTPLCSKEVLEEASQDLVFLQNHLTVSIDGAVVKPGVYELPLGSRSSELVEKAEGLAKLADRIHLAKNFNLAEKLEDGQKIYIPFKGEFEEKSDDNQLNNASKSQTSSKISINQASLKELDSLPGIGESRASQIIENRPYASLNDLVEKGALSGGIFEQIKSEIVL